MGKHASCWGHPCRTHRKHHSRSIPARRSPWSPKPLARKRLGHLSDMCLVEEIRNKMMEETTNRNWFAGFLNHQQCVLGGTFNFQHHWMRLDAQFQRLKVLCSHKMLESNQENMWNTLKYIKVQLQEEICMQIRYPTALHDQQQYEMSTQWRKRLLSFFLQGWEQWAQKRARKDSPDSRIVDDTRLVTDFKLARKWLQILTWTEWIMSFCFMWYYRIPHIF